MKLRRKNLFITLLIFVTIVSSCKQNEKKTEEPVTETEPLVEDNLPEISLEKLNGSPAYEDAALTLDTPKDGVISNGDAAEFNFTVNNYELTAQTEGPNATLLANSDKGQHIHFILNNQPYSAHYEANFTKEIPNGTHHLVAFLSRSYHESVKNDNSVVVRKLEVGENPEDSLKLDMDAPTLIYSRPKGTYTGKDTENLLLDFFVLNTTLSEEGNKVRAMINGQEFILTEWAPYVVKGLPKGDVTVQLELIDQEGNVIPGPFNKVDRTVTLEP